MRRGGIQTACKNRGRQASNLSRDPRMRRNHHGGLALNLEEEQWSMFSWNCVLFFAAITFNHLLPPSRLLTGCCINDNMTLCLRVKEKNRFLARSKVSELKRSCSLCQRRAVFTLKDTCCNQRNFSSQ